MILRKIPQQAIDFIINEEGIILHKYKDFAGFMTICVGHLIHKNEIFPDEMDKEACADLLRKDLLYTASAIMRLVKVPLYDSQYIALLSFVFNIGTGGFQASTARSRLNRGWYEGVPEAMKYWVYAGGKRSRILIERRNREAKLFASEENYE